MREGLSTARGTRRLRSGLSGSIFSRPNDCASLVKFVQVIVKEQQFLAIKIALDVRPTRDWWNLGRNRGSRNAVRGAS